MRAKTAVDYGLHRSSPSLSPCRFSSRDAAMLMLSPAPDVHFAVQIAPGLLADVDAMLGSVDEEYLAAIEHALLNPKDPVPKPNAALSLLLNHPPISSELLPSPDPYIPDDSPQGRRIKRALEVPALIPQAWAQDSARRASKDSAQRRRKKALKLRKLLQPVSVKASTLSSRSKSKSGSKSFSGESSRVEFERMLGPLSTQLLVSISGELERLREAKEKARLHTTFWQRN